MAGVVNMAHSHRHRQLVLVDRSGPWGNPFKLGTDGSRTQVLLAHEDTLRREPELVQEIWRLEGHWLGCWCDPMPCHGWLLAYLANASWDDQFEWLLGKRYWTPMRLSLRSVPDAPGWNRWCRDSL